jgi:hypothetical protein
VNDHQPTYITNLRGKKPIDIHHQHMHVFFLFTKKLANFCHLVTPPKKTQISVEKSSSKSPDSEGLFFEIAIFGQ